MSNPFPIPLSIMLSNGSRLATPPATAGTFVLKNTGSNEPEWEEASSVSGFTVLTSDPFPATDDTAWVVREGTIPDMTVELRVRIAGTTYVVASITVNQ